MQIEKQNMLNERNKIAKRNQKVAYINKSDNIDSSYDVLSSD